MEEYVYRPPTQQEVDLYNRLLPTAIAHHRLQAMMIGQYDVGVAARYLDLMCSGQYRKRKAIFPMKRR